jgi:hypothetical protein
MVTVRVFLACGTPTNRPGGEYDTFVSLPHDAFLLGRHIDIAARRARILGYPGPYSVTEVRRLDVAGVPMESPRSCSRAPRPAGRRGR